MTTVFASAAVSSALASAIYESSGWDGVAALGGGLAALGVVVWSFEQIVRRRSGASATRRTPLSEM
jgi:cyanate permease